ncbi:excreted virulence factor EspC (type VII ESX diderm) [Pseudonocardia sediminis]|uniref:Excreted virulence factor EspC (Type VII ESX diderm) n=1 Tax=Pseudonocardia sediminis TaxID=1397368 RepID=A0A4Q7V3B9_PSEST|nr:type VII secretion target [Pseudonocardia sediminis]RZT89107.1 excreted virulence factor EspC (type VII ESX diderm) [Pseudonocardia sediminis]
MTDDVFRVVPGDVRGHATAVGNVEHAIAGKTPAQNTLSTDAYGLIGQAFSGAAMAAMGSGSVAVEKLCRALGDAAGGLRDCAADYESADRRVADLFGGDG